MRLVEGAVVDYEDKMIRAAFFVIMFLLIYERYKRILMQINPVAVRHHFRPKIMFFENILIIIYFIISLIKWLLYIEVNVKPHISNRITNY